MENEKNESMVETVNEPEVVSASKNDNNDNIYINLIIGIVIALVGIGLVVTAFVLNLDKNKSWYIYLMYFMGAAFMLASTGELYYFFQNKFNIRRMNVKQMSVIAIFTALSVVLYYYGKFNLPFFPPWLDIQFSDFPALITSFMYGPFSGCISIVVRFICKLPGTQTVGVGELADLLIGITLCLVAGIIYKKHRSFKGALCAMSIGMLSATVVATLANLWILIPAYIHFAGFSLDALVGCMSYIPGVTKDNFMVIYLFAGVIPFNLFRYAIVFAITLLIYKRLHIIIEHFAGK